MSSIGTGRARRCAGAGLLTLLAASPGCASNRAPSPQADAGTDVAADAPSGPVTFVAGGRTVSAFHAGRGPSVVFESGLGDGYSPWQAVLDTLRERATVFAYDRAGYGGSTRSSEPRDGAHLVAELQQNLDAVGLPKPYLLVGHSLGGELVLLYARLHPEAVAGVVLVDGRPATFTDRCVAELGAAACIPPTDLVTTFPEPMRAEYLASDETAKQLLSAPPFPKVPVIVLSRSEGVEGAAFLALWSKMQDEMAIELSATHVLVPDSGHYVQREAPAAVISAVDELLAR